MNVLIRFYRITLGNWYDRIDDTSQELTFIAYIVHNSKTHILKNAGQENIFNFTLPYLEVVTSGSKSVNASLCVTALDRYLAVSTKCTTLTNLQVSFTQAQFESITNNALSFNFSNDETVFWTAATLEVVTPQYYRSPVHPHICTVDYQ